MTHPLRDTHVAFLLEFAVQHSRPFLNLSSQPSMLLLIVTSATINAGDTPISFTPNQTASLIKLSGRWRRHHIGEHASLCAPGSGPGQDTSRAQVILNWSRGKYMAPKMFFALTYHSSPLEEQQRVGAGACHAATLSLSSSQFTQL